MRATAPHLNQVLDQSCFTNLAGTDKQWVSQESGNFQFQSIFAFNKKVYQI